MKWLLSHSYRRSAAFILRLIRDGEFHSQDQIENFIPNHMPPSMKIELRTNIRNLIQGLVDVGLVKKKGKDLMPTRLIENIQAALHISLTNLSSKDPDALSIDPIFGKPKIMEQTPDVFVLMPFIETLKPVYDDHIKAVCSELALQVMRADDFFTAQSVMTDIWNAIYNSKIIIADCTKRNPNVFYEIGIAHTLGKPTILIAQSINDVPFDLRHIRCVEYKYTPRGMTAFHVALKKTIEAELFEP